MALATQPEPLLTDDVIIETVRSLVGPAAMLVLGFILNHKINKVKDDTAVVKDSARRTLHQVENSHTTNLREESDDRHGELVTLVSTVIESQKEQAKDIGGLRSDVRSLRDADLELSKQQRTDRDRIDNRIEELGKTIPRPQHPEVMNDEQARNPT